MSQLDFVFLYVFKNTVEKNSTSQKEREPTSTRRHVWYNQYRKNTNNISFFYQVIFDNTQVAQVLFLLFLLLLFSFITLVTIKSPKLNIYSLKHVIRNLDGYLNGIYKLQQYIIYIV